MKIKFFVLHRDSSLFTCFIILRDSGAKTYLLGNKSSKVLPVDSRLYRINSYGFHLFLNELENCPTYHRAVAGNIKSSDSPYVVQLIPNNLEFIDKTW